MPRGCDYSVRVGIDVAKLVGAGKPPRTGFRKFIVEYDADGNVLRTKEIRQLEKPQVGIYHQLYWKAGTHSLGGDDSMPRRIIATALAKTLAEHRNTEATP